MKTELKLDTGEQLGLLAGTLLFVIEGLRRGSITAKPIIKMDDASENYPIVSLESEIWEALGKCGITEKKTEPKPISKSSSKTTPRGKR